MGLLQVLGGPRAPSGRAIQGNTKLIVTYQRPYSDGINTYPLTHIATYDTASFGWKPLGASNGTPFLLPGANIGEPTPPPCQMQEVQYYVDGGIQSFLRSNVYVIATAPSIWQYGSPANKQNVQNTNLFAKINADGTAIGSLPSGWSSSRVYEGRYTIIHNIPTPVGATITVNGSDTDTIVQPELAYYTEQFSVHIKALINGVVEPIDKPFTIMVTVQ